MAYFHRWPQLIYSRLCHQFSQDGYHLQVEIYRLEGRMKWQLEVVNEEGTSVVWNQQFATECDAEDAFQEKIECEGIGHFLINEDDESNNSMPSFSLQ